MKRTPKPRSKQKPTRWPPYTRIPPFLPVELRSRRDGWSPILQGWFIGHLAETGSVSEAAAFVKRSRESAYCLRCLADAGSFAHAWDAVLAIRAGKPIPPRKFTQEDFWRLAFEGGLQVRMRHSHYAGTEQRPCDRALLPLLRCYRRAAGGRARRHGECEHSDHSHSTYALHLKAQARFAPAGRAAIAGLEQALRGNADGR